MQFPSSSSSSSSSFSSPLFEASYVPETRCLIGEEFMAKQKEAEAIRTQQKQVWLKEFQRKQALAQQQQPWKRVRRMHETNNYESEEDHDDENQQRQQQQLQQENEEQDTTEEQIEQEEEQRRRRKISNRHNKHSKSEEEEEEEEEHDKDEEDEEKEDFLNNPIHRRIFLEAWENQNQAKAPAPLTLKQYRAKEVAYRRDQKKRLQTDASASTSTSTSTNTRVKYSVTCSMSDFLKMIQDTTELEENQRIQWLDEWRTKSTHMSVQFPGTGNLNYHVKLTDLVKKREVYHIYEYTTHTYLPNPTIKKTVKQSVPTTTTTTTTSSSSSPKPLVPLNLSTLSSRIHPFAEYGHARFSSSYPTNVFDCYTSPSPSSSSPLSSSPPSSPFSSSCSESSASSSSSSSSCIPSVNPVPNHRQPSTTATLFTTLTDDKVSKRRCIKETIRRYGTGNTFNDVVYAINNDDDDDDEEDDDKETNESDREQSVFFYDHHEQEATLLQEKSKDNPDSSQLYVLSNPFPFTDVHLSPTDYLNKYLSSTVSKHCPTLSSKLLSSTTVVKRRGVTPLGTDCYCWIPLSDNVTTFTLNYVRMSYRAAWDYATRQDVSMPMKEFVQRICVHRTPEMTEVDRCTHRDCTRETKEREWQLLFFCTTVNCVHPGHAFRCIRSSGSSSSSSFYTQSRLLHSLYRLYDKRWHMDHLAQTVTNIETVRMCIEERQTQQQVYLPITQLRQWNERIGYSACQARFNNRCLLDGQQMTSTSFVHTSMLPIVRAVLLLFGKHIFYMDTHRCLTPLERCSLVYPDESLYRSQQNTLLCRLHRWDTLDLDLVNAYRSRETNQDEEEEEEEEQGDNEKKKHVHSVLQKKQICQIFGDDLDEEDEQLLFVFLRAKTPMFREREVFHLLSVWEQYIHSLSSSSASSSSTSSSVYAQQVYQKAVQMTYTTIECMQTSTLCLATPFIYLHRACILPTSIDSHVLLSSLPFEHHSTTTTTTTTTKTNGSSKQLQSNKGIDTTKTSTPSVWKQLYTQWTKLASSSSFGHVKWISFLRLMQLGGHRTRMHRTHFESIHHQLSTPYMFQQWMHALVAPCTLFYVHRTIHARFLSAFETASKLHGVQPLTYRTDGKIRCINEVSHILLRSMQHQETNNNNEDTDCIDIEVEEEEEEDNNAPLSVRRRRNTSAKERPIAAMFSTESDSSVLSSASLDTVYSVVHYATEQHALLLMDLLFCSWLPTVTTWDEVPPTIHRLIIAFPVLFIDTIHRLQTVSSSSSLSMSTLISRFLDSRPECVRACKQADQLLSSPPSVPTSYIDRNSLLMSSVPSSFDSSSSSSSSSSSNLKRTDVLLQLEKDMNQTDLRDTKTRSRIQRQILKLMNEGDEMQIDKRYQPNDHHLTVQESSSSSSSLPNDCQALESYEIRANVRMAKAIMEPYLDVNRRMEWTAVPKGEMKQVMEADWLIHKQHTSVHYTGRLWSMMLFFGTHYLLTTTKGTEEEEEEIHTLTLLDWVALAEELWKHNVLPTRWKHTSMGKRITCMVHNIRSLHQYDTCEQERFQQLRTLLLPLQNAWYTLHVKRVQEERIRIESDSCFYQTHSIHFQRQRADVVLQLLQSVSREHEYDAAWWSQKEGDQEQQQQQQEEPEVPLKNKGRTPRLNNKKKKKDKRDRFCALVFPSAAAVNTHRAGDIHWTLLHQFAEPCGWASNEWKVVHAAGQTMVLVPAQSFHRRLLFFFLQKRFHGAQEEIDTRKDRNVSTASSSSTNSISLPLYPLLTQTFFMESAPALLLQVIKQMYVWCTFQHPDEVDRPMKTKEQMNAIHQRLHTVMHGMSRLPTEDSTSIRVYRLLPALLHKLVPPPLTVDGATATATATTDTPQSRFEDMYNASFGRIEACVSKQDEEDVYRLVGPNMKNRSGVLYWLKTFLEMDTPHAIDEGVARQVAEMIVSNRELYHTDIDHIVFLLFQHGPYHDLKIPKTHSSITDSPASLLYIFCVQDHVPANVARLVVSSLYLLSDSAFPVPTSSSTLPNVSKQSIETEEEEEEEKTKKSKRKLISYPTGFVPSEEEYLSPFMMEQSMKRWTVSSRNSVPSISIVFNRTDSTSHNPFDLLLTTFIHPRCFSLRSNREYRDLCPYEHQLLQQHKEDMLQTLKTAATTTATTAWNQTDDVRLFQACSACPDATVSSSSSSSSSVCSLLPIPWKQLPKDNEIKVMTELLFVLELGYNNLFLRRVPATSAPYKHIHCAPVISLSTSLRHAPKIANPLYFEYPVALMKDGTEPVFASETMPLWVSPQGIHHPHVHPHSPFHGNDTLVQYLELQPEPLSDPISFQCLHVHSSAERRQAQQMRINEKKSKINIHDD